MEVFIIIKVLIVDDQIILLDGLKVILESDAEINVIGTVSSGQNALAFIESNQPDVILMDIRMPLMSGLECLKIIKNCWSNIEIIMLTTFDNDEYIVESLKCGAKGFILKDISSEKLIQAVKDAVEGNLILPSNIAVKLANCALDSVNLREERFKKDFNLSNRELDIAIMISQGFTNKQIAKKLFMTNGTIKNYVSSIYGKIGISDRCQAAIFIKDRMH